MASRVLGELKYVVLASLLATFVVLPAMFVAISLVNWFWFMGRFTEPLGFVAFAPAGIFLGLVSPLIYPVSTLVLLSLITAIVTLERLFLSSTNWRARLPALFAGAVAGGAFYLLVQNEPDMVSRPPHQWLWPLNEEPSLVAAAPIGGIVGVLFSGWLAKRFTSRAMQR